MSKGSDVLATSIIKAIEIANELRGAYGGGDKLVDLPRSVPGSATACVLANAFGFGCEVRPDKSVHGDGKWKIFFPPSKGAQAAHIAKLLGVTREPRSEIDRWAVELPEDIARIAIDFDAGRLSEQYYQG